MAAMFMVGVAFISFKIVFAATTITVNTIVDENDTGADCSLREAIITANTDTNTGGCVRAGTGEDIITFELGSGTPSIAITASLPVITAPVTINGDTGGATRVELNGSGAGAGSSGLIISGGDSTINALVINQFDGNGIVLTGNGGNLIIASFIGVNAAGTGAAGNGEVGILIEDVPDNTIGGPAAGEGNVIAGNFLDGIQINGINATGNTMLGNAIGTDLLGAADLGNGDNGISVVDAATNMIGGTSASERNVISGNNLNGILITGNDASGNMIQGNYIGTDKSGSLALGNTLKGVQVDDAPDTLIGGTTAGAGNLISGNLEDGVYLVNSGATGNLVQGNFVGTNAAGTGDLGNKLAGVTLDKAPNNTIGGTTAAARNLISGNDDVGVCIINAGATENLVQGNYIGTDVTGTADLGNVGQGVLIRTAANNTIGGTATGAGNLISGNDKDGVIILTSGATGNLVQGNFVGTNAAGTAAVPNTLAGVTISGGVGNTVGGTTVAARNLVSGNADAGICIISNASDNIVQGNYVGVDVTGVADLGNAGPGVFLANTSDNTIGGTAADAGNLIAFNRKAGIALASGSGNTFRANRITGNTHLGITLSDTITVTANDIDDADVGPNGLQNFPLLTSAISSGSNTTVIGAFNSAPNANYTLEFFANTACDASGYGEGHTLLGAITVITDGVGNEAISFVLNTAIPLAQFITATATDANGNTSEFSACVAVTGPGGVTATPTATGTQATATPTTTGTPATATPTATTTSTATATPTGTRTPQNSIYLPLVER